MVSRRIGFCIFPLFITMAAWAQDSGIYKHRSESGAVLYSDKPEGPRGSTTEQLPAAPVTTISSPSDDSGAQTDDSADNQQPPVGYQQLVISSPAAGQTVRSNNGDVTVSIALQPPLVVGDVAVVLLDGTPRAQIVAPDSSAIIPNVDRGQHSVQVVVSSANRVPLISSAVQSFVLHRFSALSPPN